MKPSLIRLDENDPLYHRWRRYRKSARQHGRAAQQKSTGRREWDDGLLLGMADERCSICGGAGKMPRIRRTDVEPCGCVLRRIFRICLDRWRFCKLSRHVSVVHFGPFACGSKRSPGYGRVQEEYIADFEIIARRHLSPREWDIVWYYRMHEVDWERVAERVRMDRGAFFHSVYRIEQRLGRAFYETQPYGIYPIDEYFGGRIEHKYDDRGRDENPVWTAVAGTREAEPEQRPLVMRAAS